MQSYSVAYCSNVLEMYGIGYFEASHTIVVPPLLEMRLKGPSAPIRIVSTDFTFVFDAQSMQLVEPIGNGLSVPSKR